MHSNSCVNIFVYIKIKIHLYIDCMAIQKNIQTEYGIDFRYHKIVDVRITTRNEATQLIITVASYLSKEARIQNKDAVYHECCILGADFALSPFYALLKAKFEDFAEGFDDMDNSFKQTGPASEIVYVQQTPTGSNAKKRIEKTEEQQEEIPENDEEEKE